MKETAAHIARVAATLVACIEIDHATLYESRYDSGLAYLLRRVPPEYRPAYERAKAFWSWWTQVCTNIDEEWLFMRHDPGRTLEGNIADYILFHRERGVLFHVPSAAHELIISSPTKQLTTS